MIYEEFEKRITELMQTPDTALAGLKPILDDVKVDYETILSLTQAKEKYETRIRDLQDTNMKLFLAQSGKPAETQDDDDLTGQDAIDAFVSKLNKEEE